MDVVGDLSALDRSVPIAFVPTMGALHRGHVDLINRARTYTSSVVVSVFVNPLQFDNADDLLKYPRTPEMDGEIAQSAGASTLWFPQMAQLYPNDFEKIPTPPLGEIFEGVHRPGHFSGVLTAVSALFTAVKPRWAIFGEKDFQQLFLIREMAKQMQPDIEIVGVETVRDSDGLAISSRNVRLDPESRSAALVLPRALGRAALEQDLPRARQILLEEISMETRFILDYAEIIDETTFSLATKETSARRGLVAGWVGGIRLIDNLAMSFLAPSLAPVAVARGEG